MTAPPYDVTITNIQFYNGGGKGPTYSGDNYSSSYYRGWGQPGTTIKVSAVMDVDGSSSPMYGSVNCTVTYTDGSNSGTFTVTISNGSNTGQAQVPYSASWIASNATTAVTYTVTSISGTFVDSLDSSSSNSILWDRSDPPDDGSFPPTSLSEIGIDTTTSTCKLSWTPVSTATGSFYNNDFYEYRVKFREYSDDGSNKWRTWSGTNDPTLRLVSNNPTPAPDSNSSLHFTNGKKYTTLSNLKIFTQYEFYIEAVDVFGNVSASPAEPYIFTTQPYSVQVTLSDGITEYSDFSDLTDPTLRTLRASNIEATMTISSADSSPEGVRVWFTATDDSTNIVSDEMEINSAAFAEDTLFSVEAKAVDSGVWVAYLSSDTAAITLGNSVRMVIEVDSANDLVFTDKDASDLNPNDDEWTFYIGTSTDYGEKPAQILNNVITNQNPRAYPSYYLSEDGYVTITVYDIKGRKVATILDDAFRRGGQNIKENGWRGTNRSGRKLGIGLYYIRIKAKSATSGKTILNKVKKVVVAR